MTCPAKRKLTTWGYDMMMTMMEEGTYCQETQARGTKASPSRSLSLPAWCRLGLLGFPWFFVVTARVSGKG